MARRSRTRWVDWRAEGGPQLIRIESAAPPHGGQMLRLITQICDQFGLPMRAVPAPYNPRSDRLPPPRRLHSLLSWYRKHGFEHIGDYAFAVGSQIDTDHIMRLAL